MIGKWAYAALCAFFLLASAPASFAAAPPVKDKEYSLIEPPLPPLDGANGSKVEVIEFFYYGCPHCYNLQPALKAWLKNPPKDIDFKRMPTVFRESWVPLTRTYYALESIGVLEKLHDDVFNTVQKNNVNLGDRNLLLDWAVGSVPLAGDVFDALYKAHLKNLKLLERAAEKRRGGSVLTRDE